MYASPRKTRRNPGTNLSDSLCTYNTNLGSTKYRITSNTKHAVVMYPTLLRSEEIRLRSVSVVEPETTGEVGVAELSEVAALE